MKFQFKLNIHTNYGENVYLTGNTKALGNQNIENSIPLSYIDSNVWMVELELKDSVFNYSYIVKNNENITKEQLTRSVDLKGISQKEVFINDFWTYPSLPEVNFNTKFFRNLNPFKVEKALTQKNKTLSFRVKANLFNKDLKVCILGNSKELSNWRTDKPRLMKQIDFNTWEISVKLNKDTKFIEYKYGVYDSVSKSFLRFEQGNSRFYYPMGSDVFQIINDNNFINLHSENWRGTGVAIPVFSLRSKKSFGVGEFYDLRLLADWCKKTGIQMIQVLPINDTTATNTWTDSYPYAGISIYALHPQFLNIAAIPYEKPDGFEKSYKKSKKKLNKEKQVDYEKVNKLKTKFLREIFDLNVSKIRRSRKFKRFMQENENWLKPYAGFCVLRDHYGTADFNQWEKDAICGSKVINRIFRKNSSEEREACFYQFVQWQLHEQLSEVVDYVHQKNIVLKGDIPIGIYRYSADSWAEPQLYHQDQQAGAPPDDFTILGQNWEFPTYNWEEMQKDNFQWWKNRFNHLTKYFDAFRIDHILGFFRIWQIPKHCTQGLLGYFYPALNVTVDELNHRGIGWNEHRFTKPFINKFVLGEFFGDDVQSVYENYFEGKNGEIQFKEEFDTQRKVEDNFDGEEHIKEKLLAVHANVIFINEGTSENPKLHPRYALQYTSSYRFLSDDIKHKLNELYNDYFYHRNEEFWKENALKKLPELKCATDMLVCGEDLGFVPKVVPDVMNQLSILSLQIQRMPAGNERYSKPYYAPYNSVVSPSSHDTSTLRLWWEENQENTQYYFNHIMAANGGAPQELRPEVAWSILDQHLYSPAMLAVIPIQEFFALSDDLVNPDKDIERINRPEVFPHYWRYRMHLTLEELNKQKEFNSNLKQKMYDSGRLKG